MDTYRLSGAATQKKALSFERRNMLHRIMENRYEQKPYNLLTERYKSQSRDIGRNLYSAKSRIRS
ncbi:10584_t:CDS:2 [Funneliformis mosseae]|uniref:10584_t:CDS:1 n=1 Tax=Funneliformis mosseae TaxID=27381 RepID=A0A9N9AL66_FUNMO|nr:10584_t:CDS:2 [Funneliformis mosseae]